MTIRRHVPPRLRGGELGEREPFLVLGLCEPLAPLHQVTLHVADQGDRSAEPERAGAPSGTNVLAQVDADATSSRFPVAVADEPTLRDLRASVKCKAVSGKVDQARGLVFRYLDENNDSITRANALEGNVRLYHVKDGRRTQIASWSGAVTGNLHELRVDAREDRIQVHWDGSQIIYATDRTFTAPGKVGVWTKADSITHFDDLTIMPL